MASYGTVFRVMLVGDTSVGKTCLVRRYSDNTFDETHSATIGIDFMTKTVDVDGERIVLQIWDTAGQDRYQSITRQYFKRAQGTLLLYDVTKRSTFNSLENWYSQIQEFGPEKTVSVVVGNKSDLNDLREVSTTEAKQFANKHNLQFHEASAKTSTNINLIFTDLARVLKREFAGEELYNPVHRKESGLNLQDSEDAQQQQSCW